MLYGLNGNCVFQFYPSCFIVLNLGHHYKKSKLFVTLILSFNKFSHHFDYLLFVNLTRICPVTSKKLTSETA